MKKLINFFEDLKEHSYPASTGEQFEDNIKTLLQKRGIYEISKNKNFKSFSEFENKRNKEIEILFNEIKDKTLDKNSVETICNPFEKIINNFIYQPYGSQNFPDILIFIDKYVIPLEIKFSTKNAKNELKKLPKWNSNIPKNSSLYIFSIQGEIITFFKGSDFIGDETRKLLYSYFDVLNEFNDWNEKTLNKMKEFKNTPEKNNENPFGLQPYVRKDFTYNKNFSTDELIWKNKINIFEYSKRMNWENNVIEFLENLENEK